MIFDIKNVGSDPLPDHEERGTMPPDVLVPLFPGADHSDRIINIIEKINDQ